jgi:hypothetical protein
MKTDKKFVNTLEDNIILRGAPLKLISDRGQAIVSGAGPIKNKTKKARQRQDKRLFWRICRLYGG